ncbi:MAG: hypothetical protein KGP12_03920 [Actinomycetales bacterium]|nr:hypothetical protein [Actinomycetales bacterium]
MPTETEVTMATHKRNAGDRLPGGATAIAGSQPPNKRAKKPPFGAAAFCAAVQEQR